MFKIDPQTGERLGLLATGIVGDGGWVDLAEPIIVRAGWGCYITLLESCVSATAPHFWACLFSGALGQTLHLSAGPLVQFPWLSGTGAALPAIPLSEVWMATFTVPPLPSWRQRVAAWFRDSSNVLALVALLISILAACFTYWQSSVAQKALDRASGKVNAKLELVGMTPKMEDIPPALIEKFAEQGNIGGITLRSLDDLIALNPTVILKNVGDEPVETLRVETRFVTGAIDTIGLPAEKQREKTPWVLKQLEQEDYPLSQKLENNQTAKIPFMRGLLGQMMQAQSEGQRDRKHLGKFEIRCYGKIVGGPTFDAAEAKEPLVLSFIWIPNGFPKEKCKEVIEGMKPAVLIEKRK